MTDIVERIASRIHDAPLPTEYLLDEAGAEIARLRKALEELLDASKHQPIDMFLRQRCKAALSSTNSNPTGNIEGGA